MTSEEYIERAEHFRKAAAKAGVDSFSRYHLQIMECSYRTLAESEAILRQSVKRAEV